MIKVKVKVKVKDKMCTIQSLGKRPLLLTEVKVKFQFQRKVVSNVTIAIFTLVYIGKINTHTQREKEP